MPKLSFDILSKLLTAIPLLLVVAPVAHAADPLSFMEEQGAAIDRNEQSGKVTFIGKGREQTANGLNNALNYSATKNAPAYSATTTVLGYSATKNDEKNASTLLQTFGPSFGLSNPKAQMQVISKDMGKVLGSVHYQQMHGGIPVIGGELVVGMVKHKFSSMIGEVSQDLPQSTTPGISADAAIATAKLLVQQQYGLYDPQKPLEATTPELQIYDPKLLDTGDKNGPARLVWRIEVSPANGPSDIHEIVFVDAQTGSIALNFNQTGAIKQRRTNVLLSNGVLSPYCVNDSCAGNDADANYANLYAGDTYDFYFNSFGRRSYDDQDSVIISNTHEPGAANNAFWDPISKQMNYGDGFSSADDVVAHELTHGVTQFRAPEFADMYVGQTGAINESFSDIFGEFVDQNNRNGRDNPEFKWLIGEDLPPASAPLRSMVYPPAYGQPDRMTSSNYNLLRIDSLGRPVYLGSNEKPSKDTNDNGGVHINSGVGNKAAFLMTDGGSFNGVAVSGLGIPKVATIYYQAYKYLRAGTKYSELANILRQSCSDLTSIKVTTPADCNSVQRAVFAVEMDKPPIR
jgi:bacillolysin